MRKEMYQCDPYADDYWDLSTASDDAKQSVTRAAEYLESRGMLENYPDEADLVRIKSMDEQAGEGDSRE